MALNDVDWAADEEVCGRGSYREGVGVVFPWAAGAAALGGVVARGVVVDGGAELDGAFPGELVEEVSTAGSKTSVFVGGGANTQCTPAVEGPKQLRMDIGRQAVSHFTMQSRELFQEALWVRPVLFAAVLLLLSVGCRKEPAVQSETMNQTVQFTQGEKMQAPGQLKEVEVVFFDLGGTLVVKRADGAERRLWAPGAKEILSALSATSLRLGILSNTGDWDREKLKKDVLPLDFDLGLFEDDLIVLSATAPGKKPEPEIYEYAIGRAGVDASRTLYVGEDSTETGPAEKLGMKSYLIRTLPEDLKGLSEALVAIRSD